MRVDRRLLLGLLLLFGLFGAARIAWAHPQIVATEPQPGAELAESPPLVRITFNERIEQAFAKLQVLDVHARPIDQGNGGRAAGDDTSLQVDLPPLGPGLYTVLWQVVGSDGHLVKGVFPFIVRDQSAGSSVAPPTPIPVVPTMMHLHKHEDMPDVTPVPAQRAEILDWLPAIPRAMMLFGAILAAGGWFFAALVLLPALPVDAERMWERALRVWRRCVGLGLILLLLAVPLMAFAQTLLFTGQVQLVDLALILFETEAGRMLLARAVLTIVLLVLLFAAARPDAPIAFLALFCGAALLLTFSLASHAATLPTSLPLMLDWIHFCAAALWGGGVVMFLWSLPVLRTGSPPAMNAEALTNVIERFSNLAFFCIIALVLSGVGNAVQFIRTPAALLETEYGRTLTLKLGIFVVLLCLGAFQLFMVRPGMASADSRRVSPAFRRALALETLALTLLIGVVGRLTSISPPVAETAYVTPVPVFAPTLAPQSPAPIPATVTPQALPTATVARPQVYQQIVGDLRIELIVSPGMAGVNALDVRLHDASGAPQDIQRVELRATLPTIDMGDIHTLAEPAEAGGYRVESAWLSIAGEWRIEVIVRRSAADDLRTNFLVPIAVP